MLPIQFFKMPLKKPEEGEHRGSNLFRGKQRGCLKETRQQE
jgi:hypothetical protein